MGMIRTANRSGIWQGVIRPTSAIIHHAINDEYSCEITVPIHPDTGYELIQRDSIVELLDANGTKQLFRLETPTQTLTTVSAFGWHISQDLARDQIINSGWENRTGAYVWPLLLQTGISERRFSGTSDISTINSLKIVRRSVLAGAIGDQDNSFVNRFGGEIERDNFTINMLTRLGSDKGYRIAYRKNLVGFEASADDSQIVNRIIPTYLNASESAVTLPEIYIDSVRIGDTAVPHTAAIHFGDVRIGYEDEDGTILYPTALSAETEVRERVRLLYANGADQPRVTIDVDFVELRNTREYREYQDLETLTIGDGVTLLYDDYTIRDRLIAYRWDCLEKRYTQITLGQMARSLDSMTASIETALREQIDTDIREQYVSPLTASILELNQSVANALGIYPTKITNADGSYVMYYHDSPTLEESQVIEYYPSPGARVWTDTGWNDGDPVWLYGNDEHGLLVMRLISTVGLNADWINVGTLNAEHIGEVEASKIKLIGGQSVQDGLSTAQAELIAQKAAAVKTFIAEPTTPYKRGDLWTNPLSTWNDAKFSGRTWNQLKTGGWTWNDGRGQNTYVCSTSRATGAFVRSDWTIVSPDGAAIDGLTKRLVSNETVLTDTGLRVSQTETLVNQHGAKISDVTKLATDVQAGDITISSLTKQISGEWLAGPYVSHKSDRSRWTHSDGSYTQIGWNGLERSIAGVSKKYFYDFEMVSVTGRYFDVSNITMPQSVDIPPRFQGLQHGVDYQIFSLMHDTGLPPALEQPQYALARYYIGIVPPEYLDQLPPEAGGLIISSTKIWIYCYAKWMHTSNRSITYNGAQRPSGAIVFIR